MKKNKIKMVLNKKDLLTVGICSVIYLIINIIFMIMSGLSPYIWILLPGIIAIFTGFPYIIMVSKIQKPGVVLILGIITSLFYFLSGQLTSVILITFTISCILSEVVRYMTKYNNFYGLMCSFICFSFGMTGSPLPMWLFRDSFCDRILKLGMPEIYVIIVKAISTNGMLVMLFLTPIVGGVIGANITKFLACRYLEKKGIVTEM